MNQHLRTRGFPTCSKWVSFEGNAYMIGEKYLIKLQQITIG